MPERNVKGQGMGDNTPARRLVAVVVTHNRLRQLQRTLTRLLDSPAADLAAVVVVDNRSNDGTAAWLAEVADPRLTMVRSARNIGGAGGFETGMRLAVQQFDPDWIVVMDDDGRPDPGALALFQTCDLTGWEAAVAAVYYPDGTICPANRPGGNPFQGRGPFHLLPDAYDGGVQQVDVASFVGLFVSRAAIRRIGYPDGRLFVYGDDGLYTLSLSQAGGRIGFFPQLRFEHDCSTFVAQSARFRPIWKVYYYHRNLMLVYRQAAGGKFWPLLVLILPKWALKIRHYSGQRVLFARLLGRAIRHGLTGRTNTDHATLLVECKIAAQQVSD